MKSARIVGVRPVGTLRTMDIEVDNVHHIFYANKAVVSNSHAVSYAFNGYQNAYAKAHFPRAFFTAYLRHSIGKPKPFVEVNELVSNARQMDIDIVPPSIIFLNKTFELIDNCPTFGLTNIKDVGDSVFIQLINKIKNMNYDVASMTWDEFLMKLGKYIKSNSFVSMIEAGAFDCYKKQRSQMTHDYSVYRELGTKDKTFLEKNGKKDFISSLKECIEYVTSNVKNSVHKSRRIESLEGSVSALEHPPYELIDRPSWKAKKEKDLLGIEMTASEIDDYDTSQANCTCREFVKGFSSDSIAIAAKIEDAREYKIKQGQNRGQKMAFIKISDLSCNLDGVIAFSEEWKKFRKALEPGGIKLVRGIRDKNQETFILKRVQSLNSVV